MRFSAGVGGLAGGSLIAGAAVAGVVAWIGCGGSQSVLGGGGDGGSGAGDSAAGSSSGGSSGGSSGSGSGGSSGSSSGGANDAGIDGCPPCDPANVNLPGTACDLDCSGTMAPPAPCDTGLAMSGPAADFARALGICQMASATTWGLVSATYTQGYNSAVAPNAGQHEILPRFGSVIAPREGANLGVLSSGFALACDDVSAATTCADSGTGDPYFKGAQTAMDIPNGTPPPGYPKSTPSCTVSNLIYDTIGTTLQIKVPKNAASLSFDFDFYSSEWPEYVCSTFNDQFVAWLQSKAWGGANGAGDLNVAWDSTGAGISVNSPFLTRCTAGTPTGCAGTGTGTASCPAGTAELQGTGFFNTGAYCTTASTGGGATGWLTSSAPVKGGETITLQFIVWDTGDANFDSSVLVDDFKWYGTPQAAGTKPAK